MENYGRPASSRGSYISRHELQQMKKNMQKVPIIQKKADHYHRKEAEQADRLLERLYDNETDTDT